MQPRYSKEELADIRTLSIGAYVVFLLVLLVPAAMIGHPWGTALFVCGAAPTALLAWLLYNDAKRQRR